MFSKVLAGALLLSLFGVFAVRGDDDVKIVLSPDGPVFLNETSRRNRHKDLVLHSIGVTNIGASAQEAISPESQQGENDIEITGLDINLFAGGQLLLTKHISGERMLRDTARVAGAPLPIFAEFQLLNTGGISGFFDGAHASQDLSLSRGEGLLTSGHHFSLDAQPSHAVITAHYILQDGSKAETARTVKIAQHDGKIDYRMPVEGAWFMRALPGIESHHRLNAATEFAVDFVKVNEHGRVFEGDRVDPYSYVGYGEPVLAAAAGTVVHVEASAVQDRAAFLPQPGETPQQRGQRLQSMMMQAFIEAPRRAAGGNLVTIRHEVDGVTEYSSYGHLKAGSVTVSVGDVVVQGQKIGEVGDTGDSPEVHLHFQVNMGADAFTTKSMPISFSDMEHAVRPAEPGLIVRKR